MCSSEKIGYLILGIYFSLVGLLCSGWIMNFLFLIRLESVEMTFTNIIRIIGVVMPPIGAICGWFL